jgi:hypothetical protein
MNSSFCSMKCSFVPRRLSLEKMVGADGRCVQSSDDTLSGDLDGWLDFRKKAPSGADTAVSSGLSEPVRRRSVGMWPRSVRGSVRHRHQRRSGSIGREVLHRTRSLLSVRGARLGVSLPPAVVRQFGTGMAERFTTIYRMALLLAAIAMIATCLLMRSATGIGLMAMRDNEQAAGTGFDSGPV